MDSTERTARLVIAIDRFFASERRREEKLQTANELFRELAKVNRMVAEARGIGKEAQLTPRMPPDVIYALDEGHFEIVDAWYRYKWY